MLTLCVIYTSDLERARRFYEAIGLILNSEVHGKGPAHYAATLTNGAVFEIYPGEPGTGRLGFELDAMLTLEQVLYELAVQGVYPERSTFKRSDRLITLVEDPDGRVVELVTPA